MIELQYHLGTSPCETIQIADTKCSTRRTKNSMFGIGVTHTQLPSSQAQVPPAVWRKPHLLQTNLPPKVRQEGCHELCWLLPSHFWNRMDGIRLSCSIHYKSSSTAYSLYEFFMNSLSFTEILQVIRILHSAFPSMKKHSWSVSLAVTKRSEFSPAQILLFLPVRLLSQQGKPLLCYQGALKCQVSSSPPSPLCFSSFASDF